MACVALAWVLTPSEGMLLASTSTACRCPCYSRIGFLLPLQKVRRPLSPSFRHLLPVCPCLGALQLAHTLPQIPARPAHPHCVVSAARFCACCISAAPLAS